MAQPLGQPSVTSSQLPPLRTFHSPSFFQLSPNHTLQHLKHGKHIIQIYTTLWKMLFLDFLLLGQNTFSSTNCVCVCVCAFDFVVLQ